ncbi:hypothetical protein J3R83DRAFT_1246 [Lanmaoa asiatica]|nr:hypothetical protein J3R83DRAFT_1246 [Lanmaoa asiatica]
MLGKGRSWKLEDLESHLDALVSEHAIARHNSTVYLRDKEDPLTHFALERSPLSSDMPVEWGQYAVAQYHGSLDSYGPSFGRDDDTVGTLLQKIDSEPGVDEMHLMPLRHVDLADDSNLATLQKVVPRHDRARSVHPTASDSHRGSRSNTDISGRGPLIPQDRYTTSSIPVSITHLISNPPSPSIWRIRNIGKKTFTLRIQWPGYKHWSKTLAAVDWTKSRDPITHVKLAQAVANGVRDLIVKYRDEPYDPDYAEWNVGPKGIQLDQICLVALHNVSRGSWQPQLCLLEPRR